MLPAFVVIAIGVDPSRTLVLSQVVLSFGIPFALIPLVMFTRRRDVMGALVNHRVTTAVAARRGDADLGPEHLPARPDVRDRRVTQVSARDRLLLRISKRMSRLSTTPAALP